MPKEFKFGWAHIQWIDSDTGKHNSFFFCISPVEWALLRITAVYISPHLPSNSDIGWLYWRRGVHGRLHIYPLCGDSCLPWHRHSGTSSLGFTSHSKDEAIEVKWLSQGHKRGGQWRVSNPWYSNHESNTLTTRPCRPSYPTPNSNPGVFLCNTWFLIPILVGPFEQSDFTWLSHTKEAVHTGLCTQNSQIMVQWSQILWLPVANLFHDL
jgi:hypothetical protein